MKTNRFIRLFGIALAAMFMIAVAGCNRLNYITYEDGDWDASEFNDEVIYNLSEFETDDLDRQ